MGSVSNPARIVSLVPSLTEALLDWGLERQLVGRTSWCTEPAGLVDSIEAVGGTKNPDVARIIALEPHLVVVNKEENRREDVEALVDAGVAIHVTHPKTLAEAAVMLERLGEAVGVAALGAKLAREIEKTLAAGLGGPRFKTFCPIWRRPWMTFREATYIGNALAHAGCVNVLAEGLGPEPRDFFEVSLEEVAGLGPELVVFPDEPYVFTAAHVPDLRAAGIDAPVLFVDGKDLSWYGPRIPSSLARLRGQVAAVCGELRP